MGGSRVKLSEDGMLPHSAEPIAGIPVIRLEAMSDSMPITALDACSGPEKSDGSFPNGRVAGTNRSKPPWDTGLTEKDRRPAFHRAHPKRPHLPFLFERVQMGGPSRPARMARTGWEKEES